MTGEIISVLLRLAFAAPKLLETVEATAKKIEADPTIGREILDALHGLEAALADVLPSE